MKYFILFSITFLLGCSSDKAPQTPQEEIPKVLKEEKSEMRLSSYSDSYQENIVEELFEELKNKNSDYKAIASLLNDIPAMKTDSLAKFENYKQKSNSYYNDANINARSIKDSLLRETIIYALNKSQKQFDKKITPTIRLIDQVNLNQAKTSDLYKVLKIATTIPLIEKYQSTLDNKSILALLKKQDELIKKLMIENKKSGF